MFLPIMEIAFAVLVILGVVTQLIIPLFRGTPIFSALQRYGIEAKLESAKQELRIAELERELAALKRRERDVRFASFEDEMRSLTEDGNETSHPKKEKENV